MVAQPSSLFARGRIGLEEFLTESERAERQTHGFHQSAPRESGDLEATSAEVEEESLRDSEASDGTGETVACFCEPSNNLDSNPQLPLDALRFGTREN